jgi:hypothetical protein
MVVVERAAPHHTAYLPPSREIFTPVSHPVWIGVVWPRALYSPQTPRPLPHVARRIQHPIGAGSLRIGVDQCGLTYTALSELQRVVSHWLPQG